MPRLAIALTDGFDGDAVVVTVNGVEAFRGDRVTTLTQIGLADSFEVDVPDGPSVVEVDVESRGARARFDVDPVTQPNVAVSLRGDRLDAAYPEVLGFL